MPVYAYKAKRGPMEVAEGMVEAESQTVAIHKLSQQGLYPVTLVERAITEPRRGKVIPLPWQARIGVSDLALFTRQLATLLDAGQPVLAALTLLHDQTEQVKVREVIGGLRADVREGRTLSEAMTHFPRVFSKIYINLVRAGEASGTIDRALTRLADWSERQEETRREVQGALLYPLLIMAVGAATVMILLTFVVPNLISVFEDLGQRLPLPTRMLLAASHGLQRWWWVGLALVGMGIAALQRLRHTPAGRVAVDRSMLRLPQYGRFLHRAELAQWAATLATLLDHGIPMLQALDLATETVRLAPFQLDLVKIREQVAAGQPLSAGLRQSALFPAFVANLVTVGEESGQVDRALEKVAEAYRRDVAWRLKIFTTLLGPVMIIVVGGLVGFLVVAMLLPIFEINLIMR